MKLRYVMAAAMSALAVEAGVVASVGPKRSGRAKCGRSLRRCQVKPRNGTGPTGSTQGRGGCPKIRRSRENEVRTFSPGPGESATAPDGDPRCRGTVSMRATEPPRIRRRPSSSR